MCNSEALLRSPLALPKASADRVLVVFWNEECDRAVIEVEGRENAIASTNTRHAQPFPLAYKLHKSEPDFQ
jgi:hypothetical protein